MYGVLRCLPEVDEMEPEVFWGAWAELNRQLFPREAMSGWIPILSSGSRRAVESATWQFHTQHGVGELHVRDGDDRDEAEGRYLQHVDNTVPVEHNEITDAH